MVPASKSDQYPNIFPQAGNGVYDLTNRVQPGGGDVFTKLCTGKGRTNGQPLKSVNWLTTQGSFHPYECGGWRVFSMTKVCVGRIPPLLCVILYRFTHAGQASWPRTRRRVKTFTPR